MSLFIIIPIVSSILAFSLPVRMLKRLIIFLALAMLCVLIWSTGLDYSGGSGTAFGAIFGLLV